jgi:hypothetical protein
MYACLPTTACRLSSLVNHSLSVGLAACVSLPTTQALSIRLSALDAFLGAATSKAAQKGALARYAPMNVAPASGLVGSAGGILGGGYGGNGGFFPAVDLFGAGAEVRAVAVALPHVLRVMLQLLRLLCDCLMPQEHGSNLLNVWRAVCWQSLHVYSTACGRV